jgi:phosphoesterase RecJ-like protein
MTLDTILKKIQEAQSIAIFTHESPDGDAIGSVLAMKLALTKLGKKADVMVVGFPRIFRFLPAANEVQEKLENQVYDLAISLDCADLKRLVGKEIFEKANSTIVIDHHGSNTMYGDLNFVNPVAPACAEILIGMFDYFSIPIDTDIGSCLLAGIITDTGGFQYSSVTAETFEFAAELLRKGVNVSDIYQKTLNTRTRPNFELLKRTLSRMEFLAEGKVTFTYITNQDLQEVGAESGDHDGLVEAGRDIEGVELAIFIRQREDDENAYKISMRSSSYINVSDLCYHFGGGGHPRAAGCLIQGNVEQVKEKIMQEVRKVLK